MKERCFLVLENGTVLPGYSFGSQPPAVSKLGDFESFLSSGEVVFNTGMTGYYEILTDPSYTGQIIMMTYPHIGNYGADSDWSEVGPEEAGRSQIKPSGLVVKSYYRGPVPKGRITLDQFLRENNVCGIDGIDTRYLTLMLRDTGSKKGMIVQNGSESLSEKELKAVLSQFNKIPNMEGCNLIGDVGCSEQTLSPALAGSLTQEVEQCSEAYKIALLDCGVKANIIREFATRGCQVTVLPSDSSAETILKGNFDGIMFSNGPGDPQPLENQIAVASRLFGIIPVFGICLGHQLISLALGAKSYKMKFGHHGVNHPVRDEFTRKVYITSQNHGFAIDEESLPKGVEVWCRNANDKSLEGIIHTEMPIMCVQFHPEAAPGPVDSSWIFDAYIDRIRKFQTKCTGGCCACQK